MTTPVTGQKSEPSAPPGRSSFVASRRAVLLAGLVIAVSVLAAWSNSFAVPFLFDDGLAIVDNPTIRHLWPLSNVLAPPADNGATVNGRPLVNLSLAFNYALGGTSVRGYHLANLLIHFLAALALFGVVRRTLLAPPLRARFGADALPLALAVALLWALHPLQTESVTYVVQRAESLAALFYLLTLYAFIRSRQCGVIRDIPSNAPRSRLWLSLSVVACALGMATKETTATTPLLVLLYDRTFVSGTFRETWRRHSKFYLGLAATWLLLAALVLSGGSRGGTAGFGVGVAWSDYALTQCRAIVHYLQLAIWPQPLVFDYGMAVDQNFAAVTPQALLLLLLLAATATAVRHRPALGFAGAWFFVILAPTSSIIPVTTQTIAEHRLYLPLAAIVAGVVLGLHATLGRRSLLICLLLAVALGCATFQRNHDYRSELALWSDTVAKRPDNARAQNNLGKALVEAGRGPEALTCFAVALRLLPEYPETHNNLGYALAKSGRITEAVTHYQNALRLRPAYPRAHDNLGNALLQLNRLPEARAHFEAALRLRPDFADAHWGLGNVLSQLGQPADAIAHYIEALRLDPAFADAHYSLALTLAHTGRDADALAHYREALRLRPDFPEADNNLGNLLFRSGHAAEAIVCYRAALAKKTSYTEARVNLANTLLETGQPAAALKEYQLALATNATDAGAHFGFANACAQLDRLPDAVDAYRETLRLNPDHLAAHANLGNALLLLGRIPAAIAEYEAALRLDPTDANLRANLDQARLLQRNGRSASP